MSNSKIEDKICIKYWIFKLLVTMNIILFLCVCSLWILRLDVQNQRAERKEIKEIKRKIATEGNMAEYNVLSLDFSKNPLELVEFPDEELLPYAIILNNVYHIQGYSRQIYFLLKNIYHSYGLELDTQTSAVLENWLLQDLKLLGNDSIRDDLKIKFDYSDLKDLFESSNKKLSNLYAMKLNACDSVFFHAFDILSKTEKKVSKEGLVKTIRKEDSLYRLEYIYNYGESTYNGITYSEDFTSADVHLQIYISSEDPKLSLEKHMYEICEDVQKDLKGSAD